MNRHQAQAYASRARTIAGGGRTTVKELAEIQRAAEEVGIPQEVFLEPAIRGVLKSVARTDQPHHHTNR